MQCKNCGANYKTRELMCPYCHTDNIIGKIWKAKRTEAELEYERERKAMGKKYSFYVMDRVLNRALIIAVLSFLLIIIGVFLTFFIQDKYRELRNEIKQDEIIKKLDEYYDEGRYAEMYDYMNKEGVDGDEYYPYIQAALLDFSYQKYLNFKYAFLDMSYDEQMEDDYYIEYAINNSITVYTMDIGVLSELDPKNEELYESYAREIESFWKSIVGLTDDDIEYITSEDTYVVKNNIDKYVANTKERLGDGNE